jgi:hypothetical protein
MMVISASLSRSEELRNASYIYAYDEWCAKIQTFCKNANRSVKMTADKFVFIRKLTDVFNVGKLAKLVKHSVRKWI